MQSTYIYAIKDMKGQAIYVGKSNDPPRRFKEHLRGSGNTSLVVLIEEQGEDNFSLEILENVGCAKEFWRPREQYWIKKFKQMGYPLCNMNEGGGGPTKHTQEALDKISKNSSKPMLGKHHTESACQKMSIAKQEYFRTHSSPMKGKHHTEKAKQKNRESKLKYYETHDPWNKGIPRSRECKQKISARFRTSGIQRGNTRAAKLYPAFVNVITGQYIPAGINLQWVCKKYGLAYGNMYNLKCGNTKKITRNGWRLANS